MLPRHASIGCFLTAQSEIICTRGFWH